MKVQSATPSAPAAAYDHVDIVETQPGPAGTADVASQAGEKVSIPEDFTKLGCMACSCKNTEMPGCFGCRSSGTFLCFEGYSSQFKIMNKQEAWFLCISTNVELVQPRTCCKVYEQIFCFECFCAIPPDDQGFRKAPVGLVAVPGATFPENIPVYSAACCSITSCNCDMPKCILDGCYDKASCLCLYSEGITARWLCWDEQKPNPDSLCLLSQGQCYVRTTSDTCCKCVSRHLFLDSRSAFPCDPDVPCVVTGLPFCVCCIDNTCRVGCCMPLEQVKHGGIPPPYGTGVTTDVPHITQPGPPITTVQKTY